MYSHQIQLWCKGQILAEVLGAPEGHVCASARNNRKVLCGRCAKVFQERTDLIELMTTNGPFMNSINALDEISQRMTEYNDRWTEFKEEVTKAWDKATYEQDARPNIHLRKRRSSRSRSPKKDVVTQVVRELPDMDTKDLRRLMNETYQESVIRFDTKR